jgi:uncharacterized protein
MNPLPDGAESTKSTAIGRVVAYGAFFAIGLVVLRFQWHILFDLDRSGLIQYYIESLLFVPPLAILGCVRAFRGGDEMLKLLAFATILMASVQLVGELTDFSQSARDMLNALDRVYGVLCLIGWPAGMIAKTWLARTVLVGALAAIILPLSLSWNFKRQEVTWSREVPRESEVALFDAVERGDLSRVESLIADGARLNAVDDGGWGVMMRAVDRGDTAMVRLLLSRGANPNARENLQGDRPAERGYLMLTGRTPLMAAAARGNVDITNLLLAAGADPLIRDAHGKTARDWALAANKPEVAGMLLSVEGKK